MDNETIKDTVLEKANEQDLIKEPPLSLGYYLELPLSEEERDLYTNHICKRIDEILEDSDRKEMIEKVAEWRNQYYGAVEETSFPWSGAYNLDTRLTPKIQDAVVAQTEEAFDDVPTRWTVGPVTNAQMLPVRDKQEKVLDYYEDTEMSNNEDLEAIRHDAFLLGLGWEAVLFERKFERVRELKIYKTLEEFIADFPDGALQYPKYLEQLALGGEIKITSESNREVRRSPVRRHIEFEDVICPTDAKGVEGVNNTDFRGRRVMMKYTEIKDLEEYGDYIKGASERLKYKPELGRNGEFIEDKEYNDKDFETFEIIYDIYLTIDGKRRKVRTLWNIEKEHKLCLRAIRYPYNHNRSYLIPHSIKYTSKGLYQDGMGRMLQDIHIAGNATINHILNSSVLANSLSLKAREGSDAARRIMEHRWYPGSVLELQNMDDAQQFQFSTPNLQSLISMFGIIEKFAQDVSGIVNYQLGVESPEDPEAPASKTIALMRKAEIKLRRYIKNLKRSEDEAGYQALRLIYQYVSPERLSQIIGERVDETKQFLAPPMTVITNSSGFAIEKIFEKRDDMTMAKLLAQTPFIQDPEILSKLIYTLSKSFGSNWDKKIIGIVPSPEEIAQQKAQAQQAELMKKMDVAKQATTQALDMGASPEEAASVGRRAVENINNIAQNSMAAQQEKGKGV